MLVVDEGPVPPPRRRKVTLRLLLTITFVGMPLLGLLGGFIWLTSTSDLEKVRREAAQRGIPLTWAAHGRTGQPPEIIAVYQRFAAAVKAITKWEGTDPKERLILGQPVLPKMRAHWLAIDPAAILELDTAIDALPRSCGPLYPDGKQDASRVGPMSFRNALSLYRERMTLAAVDEFPQLTDRVLHLAQAFPEPQGWFDRMMFYGVVSTTAGVMVTRLDELPPELRESAAEHLVRLCARLNRMDETAMFVNLLDEIAKASTNPLKKDSQTWETWGECLGNRLCRAPALRRQIDWIAQSGGVAEQEERWRLSKSIDDTNDSWADRLPSLAGGMDASREMMERTALRSLLRVELLVAELRGQPWPRDYFDPGGGALRPIVRDGKVMAGYSVGHNGADDGGTTSKDYGYPLRGPVVAPLPTGQDYGSAPGSF